MLELCRHAFKLLLGIDCRLVHVNQRVSAKDVTGCQELICAHKLGFVLLWCRWECSFWCHWLKACVIGNIIMMDCKLFLWLARRRLSIMIKMNRILLSHSEGILFIWFIIRHAVTLVVQIYFAGCL